jgi:SnoaL-like domain
VDRPGLERWLDAYERLWRTAGTAGLADLFSEDASYSTGPFREPHRGLEAISRMWESDREGPGEAFEMEREIVAVDGATGVVRLEVTYGEPRPEHYRDLWIVRLDGQGRCSHFEEWPFWPEQPLVRPRRGGHDAGQR